MSLFFLLSDTCASAERGRSDLQAAEVGLMIEVGDELAKERTHDQAAIKFIHFVWTRATDRGLISDRVTFR